MQHLQPNTTLQGGKYKIERVLGQGGFGITYLATDIALDRKVAVKEFFPKDYCDRNGSTSHITIGTESAAEFVQKLKAKFLKEVRNIAKLDHPGIIRIHAAFEENNTAYYVMDYIEGENLAEMVQHGGPLPEQRAISYIEKVGEALQYIHDRHINHLDIKPANIMVRREDDRPILIDFGLSKQYDTEGQQTSTTPTGISHGYAPMEQYNDGGVKEFSPQTDIYSLAATLYFLLSGVTPPQATKLVDEDLTFPQSIPANLIDPISKGMATSRKQRYDAVDKFLAQLKASENEDTVIELVPLEPVQPTPTEPQQIQKKKFVKNKKLMKRSCIAAFSIIAVVGIVFVGINVLKYEEVGVSYGSLEKVKRFGRYGYIDCSTGEIAIPVKYDWIDFFSDGLAKAARNGKYGYVDKTGKEVIPLKYDDIDVFSEGVAIVKQNGKYGYVDKTRKEITPLKYDEAFEFFNDFAKVKLNGKYGYVDKTGEEITPIKYDEAFTFFNGFAKVKQNDKYGYVDKTGKEIVPLKYDEIDNFLYGLAKVKLNSKYGYVDKVGKEVITPKYNIVGGFSEGLAYVQNGGCGYVDKKGKEVIPLKYDVAYSFSNGLAAVKQRGKYGYVDKTGKEVIPLKYDEAGNFFEGLAKVKLKGKYGYIDKNGKVAISLKYDEASDFSNGFAKVTQNGDFNYIDKTGNAVSDIDYFLSRYHPHPLPLSRTH